MKGEKKRIYMLVIVIVLVAIVGFFVASTGGEAEDPLLSVENNSVQVNGDGVFGNEVLEIISNVEKLDLKTSIFDDVTFLDLEDISVSLQSERVGRSNPFAPIQ